MLLVTNGEKAGDGECDALKIQSPIGCPAHEYSTLLKLEERVDPDSSGFYPFPQPRALCAFSEGGLFLMSVGSTSGMTLVDIVNTYNKSIGNVPELIALYYTARMLRHMESLHRDGKILVSISFRLFRVYLYCSSTVRALTHLLHLFYHRVALRRQA